MGRSRPIEHRARVSGLIVGLVALLSALFMASTASAKTFKADPAIADTTAASACTSLCSLRQAIGAAEAAEEVTAENETIELPAGTYTLTQGPLRVSHPTGGAYSLTIVGLGARADEVVITAGGKSRVVIDGREGGSSGLVVFKRLELTGGNGEGGIPNEEPFEPEKGQGGGIAIEQNGTLKLDEVLVTANTAASAGGAIEDVGELTVENSTIAHNTVTGGLGVGGGISSENPNSFSHELVTVVNSTIADNSVSGGSTNEGGAIYNGSILELTNSTLSGNSAPGSGGTLATSSEATSTIANNIIAYDQGRACAGTNPTSLGGNDVADVGCELSNQKKTNDIAEDPGLEKTAPETPKLADNGGPTETIGFSTSLAPPIKNGLEQYCPASDQRGAARPAGKNCSSGAYQYGTQPGAIISGSVTPNGSGTVTAKSTITGAQCSEAECTVPAQEAGKVSFTEVPMSGFGFLEWTGCGKVTSGDCEVENNGSNQSVIAKFAARYAVTAADSTPETTVGVKGSGAAASCAASSCTVDEGETVTLTAESKNPGLQFVSWSGGTCRTENPCKREHVKAAETDTANFELGPASSPPGGSVRVYFDSEASSEGNGSSGAPFRSVRSLEQLLERREEEIAHEHGEVSPLELLFAGGEYEDLEFRSATQISVYGDLNSSTWKAEREPHNPTRFVGTPQGLLLNGSTEMSFQQVTFQGRAAFSPGASAYGVRMINGSHATFADVRFEAGSGAIGARGAIGAQGAAGTAGRHGEPGKTPGDVRGIIAEHSGLGGVFNARLTCPVAAANGIWSMSYEELEELYEEGIAQCENLPIAVVTGQKPQPSSDPGNGGFGGAGGWLGGDPGSGQNGQKGNSTASAQGGAGGQAGKSESTWCCENGKSATSPGGEGGAGSAGSSSVNSQSAASTYGSSYDPGHGGTGGTGEGGAGGGGGGGGSGDFDDLNSGGGDAGGSGGSGGGGGNGGAGGEAGGGGFALYITAGSSAVVDYASDLVTQGGGNGGQGGNGGAGGAGGSGGQGSAYAASTIGAGSNGGAGGAGGPGGPGAGGEGGPSFAVAGGGSAELGAGVLEEVARPGEGGEPGGEGGRPAHSGGGGANEPCSSSCTINATLPVQLPASVPIAKGVVVIPIGCLEACTGKLTLTSSTFGKRHVKALALAAKSNKGTSVLGELSFSLPAKKIVKLRVHLSKAARKQLKGVLSIKATLTVELKLGKKKKLTKYSDPLVLYVPQAKKPAKTK
jgi:hypothetical protein